MQEIFKRLGQKEPDNEWRLHAITDNVRKIREAYEAGTEAGHFAGARVRLALFDYISTLEGNIPEEVAFRLDEGMFGGSDLVFDTKRVEVHMVASWQSHSIRLGMGSLDWLNAFPKIINGINRVRVEE